MTELTRVFPLPTSENLRMKTFDSLALLKGQFHQDVVATLTRKHVSAVLNSNLTKQGKTGCFKVKYICAFMKLEKINVKVAKAGGDPNECFFVEYQPDVHTPNTSEFKSKHRTKEINLLPSVSWNPASFGARKIQLISTRPSKKLGLFLNCIKHTLLFAYHV